MAAKGGRGRGAAKDLQRWLKEEVTNQEKLSSNLRLLKAFSLFFGSVIVFRNFGEALFAV